MLPGDKGDMTVAVGVSLRRSRWSRIGFGYLAASALVPGVWGLVDPSGWFDHFPGVGGAAWIAAEPPFNRHLTIDSAAGLFAAGILALVACLWNDRSVRMVAAIGVLASTLPHVAYHLFHPSHALSAAQQLASTGGLAAEVAIAAMLLVANRRA